MNSKKQLFYDKIQCIYNIICKEDLDKFTNLFYIKSKKASFENRKSYLSKKWLKEQDRAIKPRMFKSEYIDYPFSKLTINGRRIFDSAEEFLEIDIEPFCKRIKNYIASQIELEVDRENNYHYLYVYNINGIGDNPNIDYYYIDYCDVITPNEITIKVKPPKHKSSLLIEPYHGSIKYQQSKIILSFENSSDYISAIFNTDLINDYSKYLVGVGVGIADINQKIPVAKKVILTKEKIEDIYTIYPILNEIEIISAEENSYELKKYNNKDYNLSHLEKYIEKIARLDKLFKKLLQQGYFTSFYEQLAFKEFSAIHKLFQRFQRNRSFFTHYRKRILDILIESYKSEPYKKLSMVMPIYNEENIFEQQSNKAIELQNGLKELSSSVDIEIIFIVKDCNQDFKEEFISFLKEVSSQIKIGFALKKKIEYEVDSIDFLFTDRDDFVVSKLLRRDTTLFQLYKHKNSIDNYHSFFRKIEIRSVSYNEFISNRDKICTKTNLPLKRVMGEWYFYVYGSRKLWEDRVVISQDGRVDYYSNDKKTESGVIINIEYQSVILLDDIVSRRLFTLIFDHQPHKISRAFTLKVVGKKYKSDMDILTIGIFSRNPIERKKVYEILGEVDKIQILENDDINGRLSNYLIEKYGY